MARPKTTIGGESRQLQAHRLAEGLQGLTRVATITDNTYNARFRELVDKVAHAVDTGKNNVRRMKRSAGTWLDVHFSETRQARDFWVFRVGTATVVGVIGAAAFASIGWWVLLPAVPIAVTGYFVQKAASRKWSKSRVIDYIKKIESNPRQKPTIEDGILAEYMLATLIREHQRLADKKKTYFKGKGAPHEGAKWREAVELANQGVVAAQTIKGSRLYEKLGVGSVRGSQDEALGVKKAAVLMRRELMMIRFLKDYLSLCRPGTRAGDGRDRSHRREDQPPGAGGGQDGAPPPALPSESLFRTG